MKIWNQDEIKKILDKDIFHQLTLTADALGIDCYLVGGYVRDLYLERPTNDIDVVVIGSGIDMAEHFSERLGQKAHLSVFRNFGTAQVKWRGQEVAVRRCPPRKLFARLAQAYCRRRYAGR